MVEFNFKSQICTTVEQSKRLLGLGLKPETADMHFLWGGYWHPVLEDWAHAVGDYPFDFDGEEEQGEWELRHHPAWSLHRLLCLYGLEYTIMEVFNKDGETYDNLISMIEEAIKEGYFNKEYLV